MCYTDVNYEAMELQHLAQALAEESIWIDSFRSPATVCYRHEERGAQKYLDSESTSICKRNIMEGNSANSNSVGAEVEDEQNLQLFLSAPES
jgi:hypothetical protein